MFSFFDSDALPTVRFAPKLALRAKLALSERGSAPNGQRWRNPKVDLGELQQSWCDLRAHLGEAGPNLGPNGMIQGRIWAKLGRTWAKMLRSKGGSVRNSIKFEG